MAVACLAMLHPVLQKQVGRSDCGLLALVYPVELACSMTRTCVKIEATTKSLSRNPFDRA